MKKTAIFLAVLILFSCTAFAAGEVFSISVSHLTYAEEGTGVLKQKIEVSGEAPLSLAGKNIGLAVIRPDVDESYLSDPLSYFAAAYQTEVKSDGSYEFIFEFDDATGEYTFTVFADTLETLVSTTYELPAVSFIRDFLTMVDTETDANGGAYTAEKMAAQISTEYQQLGIDVKVFNQLSQTAKEEICASVLSYNGTVGINNFSTLFADAVLYEGMSHSKGEKIKIIAEAYEDTLELSKLSINSDYNNLTDKVNPYILMENGNYTTVQEIKDAFFEGAMISVCKEALSYMNVLATVQKYRNELNEPSYIAAVEGKNPEEQKAIMDVIGPKFSDSQDPIDSLTDLADAFDAVLNPPPSNPGNNPPANPPVIGGGGGGGGESHKVTPEEKEEEPVEDSDFVITTAFTDLDDYGWAKEAIFALTEKGILSGNGKGLFLPSNKITRAEFVKLITEALMLDEGTASISFEDVSPKDWYYSYVKKAVSNGIVKGKSDVYFGASECISRQDMATLIYRALTKLNKIKPLDTVNKKYTDYQDISDYAKNSILMLSEYGIINGYEDGTFRPFGNAARAEAAQLIYNVSLFIE